MRARTCTRPPTHSPTHSLTHSLTHSHARTHARTHAQTADLTLFAEGQWCNPLPGHKWLSSYSDQADGCVVPVQNDPECINYLMWASGSDKRCGCSTLATCTLDGRQAGLKIYLFSGSQPDPMHAPRTMTRARACARMCKYVSSQVLRQRSAPLLAVSQVHKLYTYCCCC